MVVIRIGFVGRGLSFRNNENQEGLCFRNYENYDP